MYPPNVGLHREALLLWSYRGKSSRHRLHTSSTLRRGSSSLVGRHGWPRANLWSTRKGFERRRNLFGWCRLRLRAAMHRRTGIPWTGGARTLSFGRSELQSLEIIDPWIRAEGKRRQTQSSWSLRMGDENHYECSQNVLQALAGTIDDLSVSWGVHCGSQWVFSYEFWKRIGLELDYFVNYRARYSSTKDDGCAHANSSTTPATF